MKHLDEHPEPIEGCFGCKIMGIQINTGDFKAVRK